MEISEIPSRFSDGKPPWGGTFGELLRWHYENGTRATVRPGEAQKDWNPEDFGNAINLVGRNIYGYFDKSQRPRNYPAIAKALFGEHPLHKQWEEILKTAYDKLPKPGRQSRAKRAEREFLGVPTRLPEFVGRETYLDRLDTIFGDPGSQPSVGIIFGLGGIGKTSLAVEYAFEAEENYAGVWWFSATSRSEIQSNLIKFAAHLGVWTDSEQDIEIAAKLCVQALSRKAGPWLLVYDNVETPADLESLMPSGQIRNLVTTRYSYWGSRQSTVELELLSLEDSAALLRSVALRSDQGGALNLSKTLERLPLALSQAATTCRIIGLSFDEYAAQAERLLPQAPGKANYPNSVHRTFVLAIKNAEERTPGSQKLMYLLGQCSPEPIPYNLVISRRQRDQKDVGALTTLIEFSLAQRADFEDGVSAIRVHRLVQCVARDRATEDGERTGALQRLVSAISQYFPSHEALSESTVSWPTCEMYFPHILALQTRITENDYLSDADSLLDAGAWYAGMRGRFTEAEILVRAALKIAAKRRGSEQASIRFTQHLGEILSFGYNLDKALVTFGRLKELIEAERPVRKASLFSVHCNIAGILQKAGRFEEAATEYDLAYQVGAVSEGSKLALLIGVATLKSSQRKFGEALPRYLEALEIVRRSDGEASLHTSSVKFLLAVCYLDLNEPHRAIPLLRDVLRIRTDHYEQNHHKICEVLAKLGHATAEVHDGEDWEIYFKRAVEGLTNPDGTNHPSLGTCLNSFGNALSAKGRFLEAIAQYKASLVIVEQFLSDNNQTVITTLYNLAAAYLNVNNPREARPYAERAANGCDRVYGKAEERTIDAYLHYAVTYECLQEFGEAAKIVGDLIARCNAVLPKNDPALIRLIDIRQRLLAKLQ